MPQSDSQKKSIGGHEYEVAMLDPRTSRRLLTRLMSVASPLLGGMAGAATGGIESLMRTDLSSTAFAGIAKQVMAGLDDDALMTLLEDSLANVTTVDGRPLRAIYAAHFHGAMGDWIEWLAFACQAQWQSFFARTFGGIGRAIAARAGSQSPPI